MELTSDISTQIINAQAKALASFGPHGINVVPVSVVAIEGNDIILYNFFMGKTVENIAHTPAVALTAWNGLSGVQVKATAEYQTDGELFTKAQVEMRGLFPERTLQGVIILKTTSVYDISVGENAGKLILG